MSAIKDFKLSPAEQRILVWLIEGVLDGQRYDLCSELDWGNLEHLLARLKGATP